MHLSSTCVNYIAAVLFLHLQSAKRHGLMKYKDNSFNREIVIVRMCFGKADGSGEMKFSSLIHYSNSSHTWIFSVTKKHICHSFLQCQTPVEIRPMDLQFFTIINRSSRISCLSNALSGEVSKCC